MQDFPYNFSQGVEHHNLWSETPLAGEELVKVRVVLLRFIKPKLRTE